MNLSIQRRLWINEKKMIIFLRSWLSCPFIFNIYYAIFTKTHQERPEGSVGSKTSHADFAARSRKQ